MWALLLLLQVVFPLWGNSGWSLYLLGGSCIYLTYAFAPASVAESAPISTFPPAKIAYYSCVSLFTGVKFCPSGTDFSCYCTDPNALATMAYCFQEGHAQQIPGFLDMCSTEANVDLEMSDFERALEHYHQNATEFHNMSFAVDPVRLSDVSINLFRDAYDQFLGNYNRSISYGWILVMFWGFVFLAAAAGNWAKILAPKVHSRLTGSKTRFWRSHISLPALRHNKTTETPFLGVLDFLAPTRVEVLVLVAFSLLTVSLLCHDIRFVVGGPFFPTKTLAFMRYYAVRSGTLASYLLPLSVLFAGRNNILQWLTRWDYSVFVMFHRWISRWMVALLVVHSVGYSRHMFKVRHIEQYVWMGILGTLSGLAIIVQGLLVLRRKWYEAFLAIHIALAVAFMVGAWFHVKDLRFLAFYYASVALWAADRLFRLQRLFNFGFPIAKVQLFEDDTLKVVVPVPAGFHAEGGGHCFVHFLQWSCFWQSHPFTYTIFNEDIIFYVKVKDGVTRRLRQYLYSNPSKSAHIRVAVEGSYGEATAAHRYSSSIFVAGGNGIPGIFAEAVNVADQKSLSCEIGNPARVKLLWVVREYRSALWFYDELNSLAEYPIDVHVYFTKPSPAGDPSDKTHLLENTFSHKNYHSVEAPETQLRRKLPHVTFHRGRPNLREIVAEETDASPGSTCFVTCGHPVMVDDLRAEVVKAVAHSQKRVDYFEQLQVWA